MFKINEDLLRVLIRIRDEYPEIYDELLEKFNKLEDTYHLNRSYPPSEHTYAS